MEHISRLDQLVTQAVALFPHSEVKKLQYREPAQSELFVTGIQQKILQNIGYQNDSGSSASGDYHTLNDFDSSSQSQTEAYQLQQTRKTTQKSVLQELEDDQLFEIQDLEQEETSKPPPSLQEATFTSDLIQEGSQQVLKQEEDRKVIQQVQKRSSEIQQQKIFGQEKHRISNQKRVSEEKKIQEGFRKGSEERKVQDSRVEGVSRVEQPKQEKQRMEQNNHIRGTEEQSPSKPPVPQSTQRKPQKNMSINDEGDKDTPQKNCCACILF